MHKIWTLTHQRYTSIRDKSNKDMKTKIEVLVVKPQTLDESKKVWIKPFRSWLSNRETPSKVRWFRSFQIVHIKQIRTMFQISEEWRPNPFYQLDNKAATVPGKTHWIPKALKLQDHKTFATGQCKRRWSTVSPLEQHMQHQLGKE